MKKFGFTLAEVLITLGVLGIVAMITLPALHTNTKYTELQAQFKRTFTDLNDFAGYFQSDQGISVPKYTALYGGPSFYSEYRKYIANSAKISDASVWNMANSGTNHSYKQHSLTNSASTTSLGGICDASEYMVDGLGRIIFFDDAPPRGYNGPRICVDINGTAFPNIWGVDIFSFLFTVDGSVIPEGQAHEASNHYDEVDAERQIGAAWSAGTTTGASNCYAHSNGQTCAYFAQKDRNPKNADQTYWKHFVGEKQYLKQ